MSKVPVSWNFGNSNIAPTNFPSSSHQTHTVSTVPNVTSESPFVKKDPSKMMEWQDPFAVLSSMKRFRTHVLVGPTGAGKTNLMFQILATNLKKWNVHQVYLFSTTGKVQPKTRNLVPQSFIIEDATTFDFDGFIEEQEAIVKSTNSSEEEFSARHVLFLWDDNVNFFTRSKHLDRLASAGRHLGVTQVCLTQRFNAFSTTQKNNFASITICNSVGTNDLNSIQPSIHSFTSKSLFVAYLHKYLDDKPETETRNCVYFDLENQIQKPFRNPIFKKTNFRIIFV